MKNQNTGAAATEIKYTRIARDENLRETVSHGSESYPFSYYYENVWDFDLHFMDWHWHSELEFVYLEKGTLISMIGTDSFRLPEGCALFINSQVIHCFKAPEGDAVIPNIVFSPRLLAAEGTLIWQKYIYPVLSRSAPWQIFSPDVPWQADIIIILKKIFALSSAPGPSDEIQTCGELLRLWDILYHNTPLKIEGTDHRLRAGRDCAKETHAASHQGQLQIMMQYIQDHYPEPLTLEDIASSVHLSKSSALKLFASYLHVSPVAYLIRCRLQHAALLLTDTEEALNTIAQKTGFNDTAYFCRKFKELYGMTPTEYRRQ